MIIRALCIAILVFVPSCVRAEVVINEVAWMGTSVNANDEWIELYNNGSEAVALDGWILSDGVALSISLTGVVGQGEYVLLERTDDTTIPSVTAFQIYTGALANDGRTLTLTRQGGGTENSVVGGTDWALIGGSNETKDTAQRTSSGWVTGVPTPGEENVSSGSLENENEEEEENNDTESETVSVRTSGGSSSAKKTTSPKPAIEPMLTLSIHAPKIAYVHQEVDFKVVPQGLGKTIMNSLAYTWNFGDTYTNPSKDVTHSFDYPGEYVVVVNGTFAKQDVVARHEITVLPATFTLTRTESGDVVVQNKAKYEVDLAGFLIRGTTDFIFPKYTILKAGGALTISKGRVGANAQVVSLYDTKRTLVVSDAPIIASVPQTFVSNVSKEKVLESVSSNTTATPIVNDIPQENVIRIGDATRTTNISPVKRLFERLAYFFGF